MLVFRVQTSIASLGHKIIWTNLLKQSVINFTAIQRNELKFHNLSRCILFIIDILFSFLRNTAKLSLNFKKIVDLRK